jgi:hypothetical protein
VLGPVPQGSLDEDWIARLNRGKSSKERRAVGDLDLDVAGLAPHLCREIRQDAPRKILPSPFFRVPLREDRRPLRLDVPRGVPQGRSMEVSGDCPAGIVGDDHDASRRPKRHRLAEDILDPTAWPVGHKSGIGDERAKGVSEREAWLDCVGDNMNRDTPGSQKPEERGQVAVELAAADLIDDGRSFGHVTRVAPAAPRDSDPKRPNS